MLAWIPWKFILKYLFRSLIEFLFSERMSDKVELPKIASGLKGELEAGASLKPTESLEKNVLPSAEDLKQEKTHESILSGQYFYQHS